MIGNDELLTIREAADYLKLSRSTVYRHAKEGRLPAGKVGGEWRISRRALDELFSRRIVRQDEDRPGHSKLLDVEKYQPGATQPSS